LSQQHQQQQDLAQQECTEHTLFIPVISSHKRHCGLLHPTGKHNFQILRTCRLCYNGHCR